MLSKPALSLVIAMLLVVTIAAAPAVSSQPDIYDGYQGAESDKFNRTNLFEQEARDYNGVPGRRNHFRFGDLPDKNNSNLTVRVYAGEDVLPPKLDGDHDHRVNINKSWGFKWLIAPDCLDDATGLRFYQDHPPQQGGHKQNLQGEDEDLLQAAATAPGPGFANYTYGMDTFEELYGARLSTNESDEFAYHDRADWPSPQYARNNSDSKAFNFSNRDGFVARLTECVQITENPGWKREAVFDEWIMPNGSSYYTFGYNGSFEDEGIRNLEAAEGTLSYTSWMYICHCDSYDEAVQKLGPPPKGEYTCDFDPDATYCGGSSPDDDLPTPTKTQEGSPTETSTADSQSTPTPGETTAVMDSPTATTSATETAVVEGTETTTPTETPSSGGTETDTSQNGFGILAGVIALLSTMLLYRRN